MRRLWGFSLMLVLAVLALPVHAGALDGTFRGTALIRTDAGRRIVVVLDGDGDALADDAFVFEPRRALRQPIAPVTKEVTIRADGSELDVTAVDRSLALRLSTAMPRSGEPATSSFGTTTVAYGAALAHYVLTAPEIDRNVPLAEVETDDFEALGSSSTPCGLNGSE